MLIAGNWKMFKGAAETAEFCASLRDREEELDGVDVVVCPPYTSLVMLMDACPINLLTTAMSAPLASNRLAAQCRKPWKLSSGSGSPCWRIFWNNLLTYVGSSG